MLPNLFVKDKIYVVIMRKSIKIKSWITALLLQFGLYLKRIGIVERKCL